MALLITDAIMNWDFESVLLFLTVAVFGIIFLLYWIPRAFGHIKVGIILSSTLFLIIGLLIASPWISDWLFTGENAREILRVHGYTLHDEIKVVSNEKGSFPDMHHFFEVKLSIRDFNHLKDELRNHPSYLGIIEGEHPSVSQDLPLIPSDHSFENQYSTIREYENDSLMPDGTSDFRIELVNEGRRLKYRGFEY